MNKLSVEIATSKSPKSTISSYWRFLKHCPNSLVQQSWQWARGIEAMGKDSWVLFLAKKQGRIVGALSTFIFRHRLGTSLNSIPYPGPMGGIATDISKDHASTIYEILLGHLVAFGRQNNIDLLTTITSPFQNDIYLYERYLNPTHILKNFTQYVDLKNPLRFSHGIRQRIRKTDSSSYQICEDDKISIIKHWWLIYRL